MARSWHYPRWRRYVMQGTMWVVLGATVGLAAFVNHERRRSLRVELGTPTSHGWLAVRLPRTWQQSAATDPGDRVVARAVEPDPHGLGRTVTITRDRVSKPISPLEFLLSRNSQILGLELLQAQHARNGAEELVEPITVGGHPGVLMRGIRAAGATSADGRGGGSSLPHKEIYAATIVPSGHAIVVKLEGDRPAELSDVEIVKQLAGALEIGAQPSIGQSGETVALEGGIRFAAPEGYRPVYENDPNLLRRRLWPDGDATHWAAAELIPCVLAPAGENNDELMAIRALAAAHDPVLRDAIVQPDGPRRWRIARPGAPGPFAPRGYVVADELGDAGAITGSSPRRALMVFFHGVASADEQDTAAIDRTWDALARSVSFVGKTNFGALLDSGKDEVERFRKTGLRSLIADTGKQWWLWTDEQRRPIGWSKVVWKLGAKGAPAEETTGSVETVFQPAGGVGRKSGVVMTWTGELRTYHAFATIRPGDAEVDAGDSATAIIDPVMRDVALVGERLSIKLGSRGRSLGEGNGAVPAQYVPGGWLPLLIGRLSPESMILRTDALLGRESVGAPPPMLLMIEPVTEQPAPTDTDGTPLRILSVRVNGSSEASRWYIRPNGEVQRVTFAQGLVRTPTDEKTKWFTFGDAPVGGAP